MIRQFILQHTEQEGLRIGQEQTHYLGNRFISKILAVVKMWIAWINVSFSDFDLEKRGKLEKE